MTDRLEMIGLVRQPKTVLFGPGQRSHLPQLAKSYGKHLLIVTDERMADSAELAEMRAGLEAVGLRVSMFDGALPDVPVSVIDKAVAEFGPGSGRDPVDALIGIGGGSCMDLAKVVSVMMTNGGDTREIVGEFKVPGPGLPVIQVPTTGGTGAEVTCIAVIYDDEAGMKVGVADPNLEPVAAIIDPELTISCPPGLTAATAADALSHLVETYTAAYKRPTPEALASQIYVGKNRITDMFCMKGFELANTAIERVVADPSDLEARSDMMFAAYCAGTAINTTGTAAAHAIQAPIASISKASHGFGVGALLPYVMRFNLPYRVEAFAEIGRALGVADPEASPIHQAKAAILRIEALLKAAGVPPDIRELGVRPEHFARIAASAIRTTRLVVNNPAPMTEKSVTGLLVRAHDGDRDWWDAP